MRQQARHPLAPVGNGRLIPVVIVAVLLIGIGVLAMIWAHSGEPVELASPAPGASAPAAATSDQILESTRALAITQQQAVDQLQVVQDQLAAQQSEMKRLAEQVAALNGKIEVLQQSEASAPAPAPPKLTSNNRR